MEARRHKCGLYYLPFFSCFTCICFHTRHVKTFTVMKNVNTALLLVQYALYGNHQHPCHKDYNISSIIVYACRVFSLSLKENILFSFLIRCLTAVYFLLHVWCLPVTCTCMPFWNAIVLRPLSPKCFLNRLEQRWVWHFPYHVTKKMK